jgi:L-iditol 2-dehydrogenase
MLALQIAELNKLQLIDMERPQIGPKDVLIHVAAGGICGTDPHILHGIYPANLPIIPGHEYSGVVEAIGSEVDTLRVGDSVVIDPNIVCNQCYFCRRGKSHLCKNLVALGVNIPGGFAEYSRVPYQQAYPLPKTMSLAHAALTEPVACCLRGMDLAKVISGDRVAIFGGGPMGAIMLQLARLQGAAQVIVVEPQEGRRTRLTALGAEWVIDPVKDDPVSVIRAEHPDGIDIVFDCSGNINAIRQATRIVARGGTVMLYGVCDARFSLELSPFWVNDNEITIRGSYNNPSTHSRAIDLLASGRINAAAVVTHRFALTDAQEAFRCTGSSESLKVVITP